MALNPGLVDQYGNPIRSTDLRDLDQETARTGSLLGRPPFDGHIAWGITPTRLAGVLRAADAGQTREWFLLAEEIEEHFTHYAGILAKRRRQVAQLPITVTGADDENPECVRHADFVREWLATGTLQAALFDVLDAVGKGFSVHEVIWHQVPGRTWPARLIYRPQRHFEVDQEDGETIRLRTLDGMADLRPLKFLLHRHPSKSGNIVRSGITRMIAAVWCYATYTLKDWATFVQAYGLPIRLGKYGPGASKADRAVLWRAVSSIAGDVAAMIPESMALEFIDATDKAAGAVLYEKRMDFLNRETSKIVLGGTAGTEAINGGHAVGQEHRAAEDDVEKFDAGLLNGSINAQLIRPMIALTFGPQDCYPTISIGRPNELPLTQVVEAVGKLAPLGLRVRASQLRERMGLTAPHADDTDVLAARPAQPAVQQPAPPPEAMTRGLLGNLVLAAADADDDLIEAMMARLSREAGGALGGLTDAIRAEFAAATDLRDLSARLYRLRLPVEAFTEAMARGLALAHMAGQASIVDEIRQERGAR